MFKDATLRGWPTMGQIPACQETIWGSTSHPESQHGLPMLHQLGCWQLSHPPMLCWWSATDFWVLCQEIHGMALPGGSVACWAQCKRSWWVMVAFTLASSLTSWCQDVALALSAQKTRLASFPEHLSSVDDEHWTAAGYYNEINFKLFF